MINTLKPDFIFCVNEDVCTHAHPYLGIKNTPTIFLTCTKIQIITSHCKENHTTENMNRNKIISSYMLSKGKAKT